MTVIDNKIKFAVIIPVYNTARYLRECLDSLLAQTYTNFTAFVIDDGSTDASGKIIDEYATLDTRFKVVHQNNGGVSRARNAALDLISNGGEFDYVLFLDSDDIWSKECLEIVSENIIDSNVDMLAFGVQDFDKNGIFNNPGKISHQPKYFSQEEAYLFCFDNADPDYTNSPAFSYFLGNIVFKFSCIDKIRFDSSLKIGEDQDFKFRAIGNISKLKIISDILVNYRLRKGSLSHTSLFRSSDLLLFVSWIKKNKNIPKSCRLLLEKRVADVWWYMLRLSVKEGYFNQYWEDAVNVLSFMKNNFESYILNQSKYKKRSFIFSLGRVPTYIYFQIFNLRIKKNKERTMDYFEN